MADPVQTDTRPYLWSQEFKHSYYTISKNFKTIETVEGDGPKTILMDRPMENGKHFWKFRVE